MDDRVTFVFPPPAPILLPVAGTTAMFPVNRIFCVGRNYADHAREMGHDPGREPPFFFAKHASSLVTDGTFTCPAGATDVHHEIELAVALASGGSSIVADQALAHVFGYAVALDMTRRDLQSELKRLGRPWESAKAFDGSAPCAALQPAARIGHPAAGEIRLDVNGIRRQTGDLSQMIWPVPDLIANLSRYFTLRAGDVVLTGTPAGVGPVSPGDRLSGHIAGIGELEIAVLAAP
jgi:fumarylpyruvate hydrolase